MSQRRSGYLRLPGEAYDTPAWVTRCVLPHLPGRLLVTGIWEPAAGKGQMVNALLEAGYPVLGTDIETGSDFLQRSGLPHQVGGIVTNPPYSLARQFIDKALGLTRACDGVVAMLLRTDYDHAHTRRDLFAMHKAFAKKVVLTRRIRWIEDSNGSPSFNHAFFIWDWTNEGKPVLAYEPQLIEDGDG